MFIALSFQNSNAQSHIQNAAMTHARMTQQMNHNFYIMHLNMTNNSARSIKKNTKSINKRLKHNDKTIVKYSKKQLRLNQKLQATQVSDTKKRQRLHKWIGIYQKAIDEMNTESSDLKTLLQKHEDTMVKKHPRSKHTTHKNPKE